MGINIETIFDLKKDSEEYKKEKRVKVVYVLTIKGVTQRGSFSIPKTNTNEEVVVHGQSARCQNGTGQRSVPRRQKTN